MSDGGSPPATPPAGWYPDGTGRLRWWDGRAWGVAYEHARPVRTWAMASHLTLFAMAVIAPIVLLVTVGREDRFTRHHAAEALNAQIWFAIGWNALLGPLVVTGFLRPEAGPPGWMFAAVPVAFLLFALAAAFAVRGAVKAHRGDWWRYPLPFRFVRGSASRAESRRRHGVGAST